MAHIVVPLGSITEQLPDDGGYLPIGMLDDDLIVGAVSEVTPNGTISGRPPTFPWGGHSNGVSSNR